MDLQTVRALFARSGNRCAFPGCTQVLITDDDLFVGQICHIRAASSGGPRFDSVQSERQRDAFENLMLLCYPHHRRIDTDSATHTVDSLLRMKADHEDRTRGTVFEIAPVLADAIRAEVEEYWHRVRLVQAAQLEQSDRAMEINADSSYVEVSEQIASDLDGIESMLLRQQPEGGPTPWEIQNIYLPNTLQMSRLRLAQLKVKYLACALQLEPKSDELTQQYEAAKAHLTYHLMHSGYAD